MAFFENSSKTMYTFTTNLKESYLLSPKEHFSTIFFLNALVKKIFTKFVNMFVSTTGIIRLSDPCTSKSN